MAASVPTVPAPARTLLAALKKEDVCASVNEIYGKHTSRSDSFDICETIRSVSSTKAFLLELCSALDSAAMLLLEASSATDGEDAFSSNDALEGLAVILRHAAAEFFRQNAAGCKRSREDAQAAASAGGGRRKQQTEKVSGVRHEGFLKVKDALLRVSVRLHDEALLVKEQYPALQEQVARMCEVWWASGVQGRERLMAQTLPFVAVKALTTLKAADVKRLCAIREALKLFDYADASCDSIKGLMLRTAFCPAFLRSADGRRFIAYLFTLDCRLIEELMAIIRNQIPSGRKSVLESLGDILFRAWRELSGPCLEQWEASVQELMQSAVLATTRPMAAALNTLLSTLHGSRRHKGFDAVLMRLYEPILYRAMEAPNPSVRRNAVTILGDAFPLMNQEGDLGEIDACLSKQSGLIFTLMMDDVPAVRAAAVSAACQILDRCWELLNPSVCASWIERMVVQLAFDSASQDTRAAVVIGLTQLVDNPLAQPVLQKALPKLSPLIDDSAARVRVAMLDMLLAVRSIRAIKFYEVVSLEALFERLAIDKPVISRRIVRLVLPSYFPPGASIEESASKCMGLLNASPAAGGTLLKMLHLEGMPEDEISALAVALCEHLQRAGPSCGAKRNRKQRNEADAPDEEDAATVTTELWEKIALGIADIFEGIEAAEGRSELEKTYPSAETVKCLFDQSPSGKARAHIARMCSYIPCEEMEPIVQIFKEQLGLASGKNGGTASLRSSGCGRASFDEALAANMLSALIHWGHGDAVFGGIDTKLISFKSVKGGGACDVPAECVDGVFMAAAIFEIPSTRRTVLSDDATVSTRVAPLLLRLKECAGFAFEHLSVSSSTDIGGAQGSDSVPETVAYMMTTLCKASLHTTVALKGQLDSVGGSNHPKLDGVAIGPVLADLFSRCEKLITGEAADCRSCLLALQTALAFAGEAAALRCIPVGTTVSMLDSVVSTIGWLRNVGGPKGSSSFADEKLKITGHIGRFMYASANLEDARAKVHEVALQVQEMTADEECVSSIQPWLVQYSSTYNVNLVAQTVS